MTPYEPRQVLDEFLEFLDRQNKVDAENKPRSDEFQSYWDWLAVEALESPELLEEINLLLALKNEIEIDCFQRDVELCDRTEEIPAYRRPALETLLAKWRQNLNRPDLESSHEIAANKKPLGEGFALAARGLNLGIFASGFPFHSTTLRSRTILRKENVELYSQRIEDSLQPIFYEGVTLSVRTIISKLRDFFGETFISRPTPAKAYRILAEIRSELPDFNCDSVISEELINIICRRLGWNIVFRAN